MSRQYSGGDGYESPKEQDMVEEFTRQELEQQNKDKNYIKKYFRSAYGLAGLVELVCGIIIVSLLPDRDTYRHVGWVFTGEEFENILNNSTITNIQSMHFEHPQSVPVGILGGIALLINGASNLIHASFMCGNPAKDAVEFRSRVGLFACVQLLSVTMLQMVQLSILNRIVDGNLIIAVALLLFAALANDASTDALKYKEMTIAKPSHFWVSFFIGRFLVFSAWSIVLTHAFWHDSNSSLPDYIWGLLIMGIVGQLLLAIVDALYLLNATFMKFVPRFCTRTFISTVFLLVQAWVVFSYDLE